MRRGSQTLPVVGKLPRYCQWTEPHIGCEGRQSGTVSGREAHIGGEERQSGTASGREVTQGGSQVLPMDGGSHRL